MKKAVVLGATGGTGEALVSELLARGVKVTAFGRSEKKLQAVLGTCDHVQNLTVATGDVFKPDSVAAAARDAEVIFQCANVKYQEMKDKLLPLGESVMTAADQLGKKIVIVDGIYVYGHQVAKGNEAHPKHPHTEKGKLRVAFEKLIFSSRWKNAQPLIVRLPDYYGPSAKNAYLQPTLEGMAAHKVSVFIGNLRTPREYVYLPDAARMIVNIADQDDSCRENWHIPGAGLISGHEIIAIARKITGNSRMVIPLGKWSIALSGLFDPFMREMTEMMYLTKEGFILSGEKYEKRIGTIPRTPYQQGLAETLHVLMRAKNNKMADYSS